jgi:type I restriction enzyme R subunit
VAKFAKDLPAQLRRDFTGAMALLRDPDFQDLLMNYDRAPRTFLIAYETEDTVSSEWRVKGAGGKEYKPQDYLAAFARFVQDNPAHIEAIRILLKRPRHWSPQALSELKQKLAASAERFSVPNLQKAHEVCYQKALVDIISMIKHAAEAEEPLYTAGERVERAIEKVIAGKPFAPEQKQWLDLIEAHLIENLTIDRQDFDLLPVFSLRGGLSQATRVFGESLDSLLAKLNEAIAS